MPRLLARSALATALALLAALPATAAADTQTATLGAVQASFSFNRPQDFRYDDLRLQVARAGVPAFDAPVDVDGCGAPYCVPSSTTGHDAVRVVDLEGDGEPEVLLDVFTGGAHCCVRTEILRWNGSAYAASQHDWADVGYSLRDLDSDGRPEFVAADARFRYAFASFADSAFPLRILRMRDGRLRERTRHHRAAVRKDARKWKAEYRKRRSGQYALGVLAAYVADEWRLGHRKPAHRMLKRELRHGRLQGVNGWPRRSAYIRTLEKRLKRWGY